MSKRKVLIIELDSATWDILNPLMEKGYMPNLRKMAKEGTSGILKSTLKKHGFDVIFCKYCKAPFGIEPIVAVCEKA